MKPRTANTHFGKRCDRRIADPLGRQNPLGSPRRFCLLVALPAWVALLAASAPAVATADEPTSDQRRLFERQIAPLLARHCMECHDGATRDGGLDLSTRSAALVGGDSGALLQPGDSEASLLWHLVESDDMPQNRAPLSDQQKSALQRWIDAGAPWTLDQLDPDAYVHDGAGDELWVQRLTVPEYIETVRAATGVDIEDAARRILPRDQRADGFTNTAYNLSVDLEHIQAYARLAAMIVERVDVGKFAGRFVDCTDLQDQCVDQLLRRMGLWVLRGPLSEEELSTYRRVAAAVQQEGGHFEELAAYLLQAMLQSPRFIYRIEPQRGDGSPRSVDDYSLASRLSYIIWGAPPDEALMEAAGEGRLQDGDELNRQVQRMLGDSRAVDRSLQFIGEWIDLNRLSSLRPDPERFPQWTPQLAEDMKAETIAYFKEIAWDAQRPLWDLMNAPFTHATPRLAYHYGLFDDSGQGDQQDEDQLAGRVQVGLQLLYTPARDSGAEIRDRSGSGERLDLKVEDNHAVLRGGDGLQLRSSTAITTNQAPRRLVEALQRSRAVTLEAWVTPSDTAQSGPARIMTLSRGIAARNFTLGQDAGRYDVRLRATKTDGNGLPSLQSPGGSVITAPQHVVFTRGPDGATALYIDGRRVAQGKTEGDFGNWDKTDFRFVLGNETSGDRPWTGTLHLAAVYDRALSSDDVRQNHAAGGGVVEDRLASLAVEAAWQHADRQGLMALYQFDAIDGDAIPNRSGSSVGVDLKLHDRGAIEATESGLTVYSSTRIDSGDAAKELTRALKRSKAFTVEAWVTPANDTQDGPARIVTLSSGSSQRNFTLGQEGNRFDARVRAADRDNNGLPSISSAAGTARPELTHLVLTKQAGGQVRLYVDGRQEGSHDVGGDLSNWDEGFRLGVVNETSGDRPWQGTLHLVAIYDRALSAKEISARGSGIARYDLQNHPSRGGLLTHGSVLTIGGDEASMVARGLFVLHDLLYSRVGNPPACVDTTPVPTEPGMSMRDLAEARLADSSCTGCHAKFEPLAFGLEKFDGVGAYQEIDIHGNQLREDGEIRFPGEDQPLSYETSEQLSQLLADSDRVRMAITRKVVQFSLGRPLTASDLPHLRQIHQNAVNGGGTYQALLTAIVRSDLVRKTRSEIP